MEGEVILEPFEHQVGGITRILRVDPTSVCKPCFRRELIFYKTLPHLLKPLVPEFKGLLDPLVEIDEMGEKILKAVTLSKNSYHKIVLKKCSCHGELRDPVLCLRQRLSQHSRAYAHELSQIEAIKKEHDLKYMVFENILAGFKRPCILDLKVGVRLYGDDHKEEVRNMKMDKYRNTTSCTLGVRNCGMKVFNIKSGSYTEFSKYECFNYTIDQFTSSLRCYLHDGYGLRLDVLRRLMEKLRLLRETVKKLEGVRLYSVSVLLVYDSYNRSTVSNSGDHKDILGFQRAKCSNNADINCATSINPNRQSITQVAADTLDVRSNNGCNILNGEKFTSDVGYLNDNGAHTPARYSDSSYSNTKFTDVNHEMTTFVNNNNSLCDEESSECLSELNESSFGINVVGDRSVCRQGDVRLIDFAHATHPTFPGDDIRHSGPHRGYLYGIDNLLTIFNDISISL